MAEMLSEQDDELPTCSICFYAYDDGEHAPLILPCGHTMCQKCTDDILKSGQCLCPQCRTPFNKGQSSKNFELVRGILVIKKLKEKSVAQPTSKPKPLQSAGNESSDVTICSVCKYEDGLKCVVCTDCADGKPMCNECFELSHRRKATKHQTTPWSSANMPTMCRDHQQERCALLPPL